MSHPAAHTDDNEDEMMLKPRPRGRAFELSSAPSSAPSTPPSDAQPFSNNLNAPGSSADGSTTPSRTKSILNLTSSTLFGIYQPTGYATDREEPSTPWGTGAETPIGSRNGSFDFTRSSAAIPDPGKQNGTNGHVKRRRSTITPARAHHRPRRGFKRYFLPLAARVCAMFATGVCYGMLISHLHDKQEIAPVKVEGLNRQGWVYLAFWGTAGALLGEALPHIDKLWAADDEGAIEEPEETRRSGRGSGDWLHVVRAIGAFVGIAFAIRKLPWESTLQLSLTLALANPALWYIIDRSPTGFLLSAAVAFGGTAVLLSINPAWVPSPSPAQVLRESVARRGGLNGTASSVGSDDLVLGVFSQESVGVATWIASVLFVSSVCFGNIGRRLVPWDS